MNVIERSADKADALSAYDEGFTIHEACVSDPRFSYSLYVPKSACADGVQTRLIVAVHGTGRRFEDTLHVLAHFGRWNDCIILCPLFPAGIQGDRNIDGYKYMIEGDIRYDLVLISMVDEISRRYGLDFSKFLLCGFSGGGHFAHRFLLLHPDRLAACSIGAPGSVTLIDPTRPWWVGTQDVPQVFGAPIDLEALKQVPVHMAVGSVDLETWQITHKPGSRYFIEGANDAGITRPERIVALHKSFEDNGINCALETIPGAAHDEKRYYDRVQEFFAQILRPTATGSAT